MADTGRAWRVAPMVYWLCQHLGKPHFFHTILPGMGSFLTGFLLSLWGTKLGIPWLRKSYCKGQPIREHGPASHRTTKAGTPTMGGVFILTAWVITTFLWGNLRCPHLLILLSVTLGFGALGASDDYKKITTGQFHGLSAKQKFLCQSLISALGLWGLFSFHGPGDYPIFHLYLPFLKSSPLPLGVFFGIFGIFVIVGSSNSVNLTDGLDGLALFPSLCCILFLGSMGYLASDISGAEAFNLPFVSFGKDYFVLALGLGGACLGFLGFNVHPASIFMGDTGSLALGGFLGASAVFLRQEVILAIIGGLFVLETLSVVLQVSYYKRTKKRLWKMTPIHHHFEYLGYPENKIVLGAWVFTLVMGAVALGILFTY